VNQTEDPAFDVDYSRLNPDDFVAVLAAMNEPGASTNNQYASDQTPYYFSGDDTTDTLATSFHHTPLHGDNSMPTPDTVFPALPVAPTPPAATTPSLPVQTMHSMTSQAVPQAPVLGTQLVSDAVTTVDLLTPPVLRLPPATSQTPTQPISVEHPNIRRRARPSVPFNRRELDNVIGSLSRPQNKKRCADGAIGKQPAKYVSLCFALNI
jgi:hypothetical protein